MNLDSALSYHNTSILHQVDSMYLSINNRLEGLSNSVNRLNDQGFWSENKDWILLIAGAILGIAATIFLEKYYAKRRAKKHDQIYSRYEGVYVAFDKYTFDKAYNAFELKRAGNVFEITRGISFDKEIKDFSGFIHMDEVNPYHGSGYYRHEPDEQHRIGFGFVEVQLSEKMILVHCTYFENGSFYPFPFIWKKQENYTLEKAISEFCQTSNDEQIK